MNKVFEMDVLIVLRDRDTGKLSQYTSGDKISGHFSLEEVARELENLKGAGTKLKFYDDDDFEKLNKWPQTKQAAESAELLKKRDADQVKHLI